MKQGERRLIHLVNLSGYSQTGYFDPVPMHDIEVQLKGTPGAARAQAHAAGRHHGQRREADEQQQEGERSFGVHGLRTGNRGTR